MGHLLAESAPAVVLISLTGVDMMESVQWNFRAEMQGEGSLVNQVSDMFCLEMEWESE